MNLQVLFKTSVGQRQLLAVTNLVGAILLAVFFSFNLLTLLGADLFARILAVLRGLKWLLVLGGLFWLCNAGLQLMTAIRMIQRSRGARPVAYSGPASGLALGSQLGAVLIINYGLLTFVGVVAISFLGTSFAGGNANLGYFNLLRQYLSHPVTVLLYILAMMALGWLVGLTALDMRFNFGQYDRQTARRWHRPRRQDQPDHRRCLESGGGLSLHYPDLAVLATGPLSG